MSDEAEIPYEEGADLPPSNSISSTGVPTPHEIMLAAEALVDAAEEKLAIDLAISFKVDNNGLGDISHHPERYREIVDANREQAAASDDTLDEYAKQYAGMNHFDYIPSYFEPFTHGNPMYLEVMRDDLKNSWEMLAQIHSGTDMANLYGDFNQWTGDGVAELRDGFASPFPSSVYNQMIIIKDLYSALMTFQQIQNEMRTKVKDLADSAIKSLGGGEDRSDTTAFTFLAQLVSLASALITPFSGQAIMMMTGYKAVTQLFGILTGAQALAATGGSMESGYEDPWHLGGSANTAFEIVDNTLRRLQQIQLHIFEAENALEGMLSSSINAIETALSMPGKYTSARLLIPLRPEIADGDFSDFNAPSSR